MRQEKQELSGSNIILKPILRDSGLITGARLAAQLSRLAYIFIVVRAFDADLYGILIYLHSWGLMFLPFANLGSQVLLSRAFGHSFEKGRLLAQQLWTLRLVYIPLFALILTVLGWMSEPSSDLHPLFLIVAVGFIGRGLAVWSNHVFIANRRAEQVLIIEAAFRFLEVIAVFILLQWSITLPGVLAVHALGWLLQALFSVLRVRATLFRPAICFANIPVAKILRQGTAVMINALVLAVLLKGTVPLGRHVLGTELLLGEFSLIMQLLSFIVILPNTIGTAAIPVLSGGAVRYLRTKYVFLLLLVSSLVILGIAGCSVLFGDTILGVVFGMEYSSAAPLLTWGLVVFLLPIAPVILLSQMLMASHEPGALRSVAVAAVCGLGAAIVAAAPMVPYWGAKGILLAAGTGGFCWLLLLIRLNYSFLLRANGR